MSNIDSIGKIIDKMLNKTKWKENEMQLYDLLRQKVNQYKDLEKTYELVLEKQDITRNIHDQEWFKNSKYRNYLNSLLLEMEIEDYKVELDTGKVIQSLSVKFPKSKFWLHSYFYYYQIAEGNTPQIYYYIYLEDFDHLKRLYIAYYDPEDSHDLGENIKLPQLGEIFTFIKTGAPISKIDLLKLFSEIVLYYDESELIRQTYIGQKFPITLTYILTKL